MSGTPAAPARVAALSTSAAAPPAAPEPPLTAREVVRAWLPLAASWLLMGLELPAVSAIVARLPDPERGLAAYGGVVFPLALLIESPVIMLLAASTALSKDEASYRVVRRFMFGLGLSFTALHGLVAFSPLYDLIAAQWLKVPAEIVEPGRLGLRIMLPWTLAIAYRRTQQGVLIRFGRSREVGFGTAVRLAALGTVLGTGLVLGRWPGIVVGTCAVTAGVIAEALFAAWRVRSVLAGPMRTAAPVQPVLDGAGFLRFYFPLLVTPLFLFLAMPLASAGMSRMPRAMDSLAAWPALNGIVFTLRSAGFAYNEVVVALLDRPGAFAALERFARTLALTLTGVLLIAAVTPIGHAWFAGAAALAPALAALAAGTLWVAVPMPALSTFQSLHQGAIVHGRATRGVTESMIVFLVVMAATMVAGGLLLRGVPGITIAMAAMVTGNLAQLGWLMTVRARIARGESVRELGAPTRFPE